MLVLVYALLSILLFLSNCLLPFFYFAFLNLYGKCTVEHQLEGGGSILVINSSIRSIWEFFLCVYVLSMESFNLISVSKSEVS